MVALCGGKTIMDTFNVVYDRVNDKFVKLKFIQPRFTSSPNSSTHLHVHPYPQVPASGIDPVQSLTRTRIYEVVLGALPQVCFQALVLVQLESHDRGYLLWGSLLFSALSVSFLVGVTELDLDKSDNRKLYARVHG